MEKEIKVRKRRFAAFWAAALLVCSLVVPTLAEAAEYAFKNYDEAPQKLVKADQITWTSAIGQTGNYTVTYQNYSGTSVEKEAVYGQAYAVLDYSDLWNDAPAGHTFTGWTVFSVYESSGMSSNITLTPNFDPNSYEIRYELNGGSFLGDPTTSYTYGVGATNFVGAEKAEHRFVCWCSDSSLQTPVTAIDAKATGTVTLYAKFEPLYTLIGAGTHSLTAGVMYKLDSGVTQVDGDSSTYAGGSIFYVSTSGTYTFQ